MKNTVLIITLFLSVMVFSQSDFGIKAGLNYNFSGELKDLKELGTAADDVIHGGDNSVGYHGGIWFKMNYTDIFLKAEAFYTQYKTSFEGVEGYEFTTKKVDIPVLVGMKVFGPLYVFAGPDFQYKMQEDFSLDNTEVEFDDFTLGVHLGAGLEFGRLAAEVRWDRGLTGDESVISGSNIVTENFTFDNRPNQLLFSLSYALTGK